jgi:hypothetical protein
MMAAFAPTNAWLTKQHDGAHHQRKQPRDRLAVVKSAYDTGATIIASACVFLFDDRGGHHEHAGVASNSTIDAMAKATESPRTGRQQRGGLPAR